MRARRLWPWTICLLGAAACSPRAHAPSVRTPTPAVASATAVAVTARAPSAASTGPVRVAFAGEGSLEARGSKTAKAPLALESIRVAAKVHGDLAETQVEHVFRNESDEVLEGTFRFPMPDGAMLVGLALEIDGKLMDGELVDREKARKAYEDVVDSMRDPALLEWEEGSTFKLRVFPIEPKKSKRVVVRFVTELHRGPDGLYFSMRPPESDAVKLGVAVDGRAVSTRDRAPTGEIMIKVAGAPADTYVERTKDGAFYHLRLAPEIPAAAPGAGRPMALIAVCDRSRSMLEARALQLASLRLLVSELGADDRFTVVAGDVTATSLGALRSADATSRAAAEAFVDAREPDGASDLGAMLVVAGKSAEEARAAGLEPVVVVLGDGVATWGESSPRAIADVAARGLHGASLHFLVLGKSSDESAAREIAGAAHGRVLRPRTEADARLAARAVVRARDLGRIDDVKLVGADGLEIARAPSRTLYQDDVLSLDVFVPKTASLPSSLALTGTTPARKGFSLPLALSTAREAPSVGRRFAKAKIDRMQSAVDPDKKAIIETSLAHGVMSRYTSFLVLESEEAYARYQIARKAKAQADADARVSGDVDGAPDGVASVSPDHLQPGDPEVRIPAPEDAESVVVEFPFGETKTATFERGPDGGAWVVRFLVSRDTADGSYTIVARVTHKGGRVEIVRLSYVVDTLAPTMDVTVHRRADGSFDVRAKQRLTPAEIAALAPQATGTLGEKRSRFAHILTDAKRVEVRTPDGQTLELVHLRLGEFLGRWTPRGAVAAGAKLELVAVDRALNERVQQVSLP